MSDLMSVYFKLLSKKSKNIILIFPKRTLGAIKTFEEKRITVVEGENLRGQN